MLAERIGYSKVFYVVAVVAVLAAYFAYKMLDNIKVQSNGEGKLGRKTIASFFTDLHVMAFFLCIYIPISICAMFLEYFFPVFAEASGFTAADSSRVFMLYGISIIYLGPLLTKLISKSFGSKMSVVMYALLVSGGLAFFAVEGTITSAVIVVALLGINYFTGLKATKQLGEGMALGFYELIEYFGLMMGPMVIGSLLLLGSSIGIGILAAFMAGLLCIFMVLSRKS